MLWSCPKKVDDRAPKTVATLLERELLLYALPVPTLVHACPWVHISLVDRRSLNRRLRFCFLQQLVHVTSMNLLKSP